MPPIGGRISGAGTTSFWTVEYSVDFVASDAHTFTAAVGSGAAAKAKEIGGVTWTSYNVGASDKFAITAAGLEIDPKTDGSHLWAQNDDLPYLAARLSHMMDGLGEDDTIALQIHMDSSPAVSTAWDAYGLALWNGVTSAGAGTTEYLAHRWTMDTAGPSKLAQTFVETAVDPVGYDSLVQATPQTFFEIVLYPGNGAVANMGVYGTDFPDPLTTAPFQTYTSISGALGPGGGGDFPVPTWSIPLTTASFMIFAQAGRVDGAAAVATTSYKMRVLRRKGN